MSSFKRDTRVRLEADASFGAKGLLGTVMNKPYPKDHFRRVWWDDGTINTVPVSLLEQVTPMEELALVHRTKKNPTRFEVGARVRLSSPKMLGRDVLGTIVARPGFNAPFHVVLWDNGNKTNMYTGALEQVTPIEELALVHRAKKNSPKYPKFKVNDYAQVRWVQNDRQRTVIGRVVSIEGNDVVFYAPELGAVNLRRADLEELSPLEQLSRVKINPKTSDEVAEQVGLRVEHRRTRHRGVIEHASVNIYDKAQYVVRFDGGGVSHFGASDIEILPPSEQFGPMERLAKIKINPRKPPIFRHGEQVAVKCRDGKERFGNVQRLSSDSLKLTRWVVSFHDGSSGSYHYANITPVTDLEMLSRVKLNPVIKYLRGKDAEGVRAGVKNSLQFLNSRLMHLRSLIEAHDCGSLQADEEYDQTWDDIWHGVRDLTKR